MFFESARSSENGNCLKGHAKHVYLSEIYLSGLRYKFRAQFDTVCHFIFIQLKVQI